MNWVATQPGISSTILGASKLKQLEDELHFRTLERIFIEERIYKNIEKCKTTEAVLAAWHSKSRGAGLVPVDWTRRKYVRKARGGPPGQVLVQRSETIFVKPDERVERKLRDT